jgi:hypothetical protein
MLPKRRAAELWIRCLEILCKQLPRHDRVQALAMHRDAAACNIESVGKRTGCAQLQLATSCYAGVSRLLERD